METPFYDEETKGKKILFWLAVSLFSAVTAAAAVVGIVFGFTHWQLMTVVAFLLILYAAELILVRWWRRREIEPKVKFLVWLLVLAMLVACVNIFVSTYQPGDNCTGARQLYRRADNKCFNQCANDQCIDPVTLLCESGHHFPNCSEVFPQPVHPSSMRVMDL